MLPVFDEKAIKLCVGKIYASKGGDARSALDMCRQAFNRKLEEVSNQESKNLEDLTVTIADF